MVPSSGRFRRRVSLTSGLQQAGCGSVPGPPRTSRLAQDREPHLSSLCQLRSEKKYRIYPEVTERSERVMHT